MNWLAITYISISALLLLYYVGVFSRLLFLKPKSYSPEKMPPVSVVICAKNEAENLERNLKVIMIQKYPNFEVIVVNDQSTDNTENIVRYFCDRNNNLRLLNIKKEIVKPLPGKKFPLKVGIEGATHDIIVVTDADCKPANTLWLNTLVSEFLRETDFVLGYAPFNKTTGLLNKFIRFDNVMAAMQYFSFSLAGLPYMGVGRNMAFRKNEFLNYEESEKSKKILSGDDDLFINKKATRAATEIAIHKDSFMFSNAKNTWAEWLNQKTRHTKTSYHYTFLSQFLLFMFALLNFSFYILPLTFLVVPTNPLYIAIPFATVLLVKLYIHTKVAIKLNNEDLPVLSILLDLLYVLHLPVIFMKSIFAKKIAWK